MTKGEVGYFPPVPVPNPLEKHTADSKWQFCNCETCQRKRMYLDSLPGPKIDYQTFRHKDERY